MGKMHQSVFHNSEDPTPCDSALSHDESGSREGKVLSRRKHVTFDLTSLASQHKLQDIVKDHEQHKIMKDTLHMKQYPQEEHTSTKGILHIREQSQEEHREDVHTQLEAIEESMTRLHCRIEALIKSSETAGKRQIQRLRDQVDGTRVSMAQMILDLRRSMGHEESRSQ